MHLLDHLIEHHLILLEIHSWDETYSFIESGSLGRAIQSFPILLNIQMLLVEKLHPTRHVLLYEVLFSWEGRQAKVAAEADLESFRLMYRGFLTKEA